MDTDFPAVGSGMSGPMPPLPVPTETASGAGDRPGVEPSGAHVGLLSDSARAAESARGLDFS